jgi:hypothetical protein
MLEAVFILLEPPSPSRKIFIGSHSLPPLWFAVSVLHKAKLASKGKPRIINPVFENFATYLAMIAHLRFRN